MIGPSLPTVVARDSLCVSATTGAHIDGYLGSVFVADDSRPTLYLERDRRFPSRDAWKSFCLARGYTYPYVPAHLR